MISVPDAATLSAFDTKGLSNGALAYVQTYRDFFFLHQFNSIDLVTDEILPVNKAPFGRWIRTFSPARCWLEEGPFYISGSGSGEAPGTNPKEPITLQEFHRRVLSQLDRVSSGTAITCFVVGNISGAVQVTATAPSFGADAPSVTFDGSLGRSPLFSGTLTGAHAVNLGNVATAAAPSPWTVTMNPGGVAPLNWTPYLQKIAHVTSGPRAGTQFRILADLGGGTALIGQPAFIGDYSFDEATLSGNEPFTIFQYPKFGDTIVVSGSAAFNFQQLEMGSSGLHDVTFIGPGVSFCDTCVMQNFDGSGMPTLRASGCLIRSAVRGYAGAVVQIWNSDSFTASTVHESSTFDVSDWTSVGGPLFGSEGSGAIYIDFGWLGFINVPSPAIQLTPGTIFTSVGGGRIFGTGCTAPRIVVPNAGRFFFPAGGSPASQFAPNIIGTTPGGTNDMSLGGTMVAFSALPSSNATNLAIATTTTQ